jgi:hypothetical protein
MARPCPAAPTYHRRQPEQTVLYRTIATHLPTFLARTSVTAACSPIAAERQPLRQPSRSAGPSWRSPRRHLTPRRAVAIFHASPGARDSPSLADSNG